MRFQPETLMRLLFTFFLNFALLIIGNIMYSDTTISSSVLGSMFVIALVATGLYFLVWEVDIGWRQREKQKNSVLEADTIEKRKRDRIDSILRDLSTDDLVRLRNRLAITEDDDLYDRLVDAEGELLIDDQIQQDREAVE